MISFVLPVIYFSLLSSDRLFLAVAQVCDGNILSGLKFGSMKTFIKAKGEVLHLDDDAFVPGNILYSDSNELRTTDGKSTHLVVGSGFGYAEGMAAQAKFSRISGFVQLNSTYVLIVDNPNHCLRFMNRLTNMTSSFVGSCTSSGFRDGYNAGALFNSPWSVIKDIINLDSVIVTDMDNSALRSIALITGEVRTLARSLPDNPFAAVFNSNKEDLLVIFRYHLARFNANTSEFTPVTKMRHMGAIDGDFSKASFSWAFAIINVNNDLYMVADHNANKLRIVDIKNRIVVSLCDGEFASADGPIKFCSLRAPKSLLLKSGTLYIGESQSIRSIQVKEEKDCEDTLVKLTAGEQVKCIEIIPGYETCYPPGSYQYKISGRNCSITVTKEVKNATCPDGIREVADPKTLKAKVQLADGHEITLMVGNHIYHRQITDNLTCEIAIHVLDPWLKKRLDVSASYQLSCAKLKHFKASVLSVAKIRYRQIKLLISKYCNQSADQEVQMTCKHDVITVVWPTGCLFQSHSVKEQHDVVAAVKKYFAKPEFHILELFVPTHIPLIISPIISQEGLSATVALTPVCMGGLKYMKYMDATHICL